MLASVLSYAVEGVNGALVRVEVDVHDGIPKFDIVGLPDAAVQEARERVRSAIVRSGYDFPMMRIIVNLAPADLKKEGSAFDLPIAIGVLAAAGRITYGSYDGVVMMGELSLDGSVRYIRGALPRMIAALESGHNTVIAPTDNANEGACLAGLTIYRAARLRSVVEHLNGVLSLDKTETAAYAASPPEPGCDFSAVRGQYGAKRALEIAAAGGHNVMMIGAPGSGKTLMAQCVPGILPDMTFKEALETTRIHSVDGLPPGTGLLTRRPFRMPHHTASSAAMVGGGRNALPGEISKAHNGVLFLDEMAEYGRSVLESLRQPLEDGRITIIRVNAQITYPCRFMLVASMNPCPCGYFGSRTRECRCTPNEIRRYQGRISGPLLDRIDMHVNVESVPVSSMAETTPEEASSAIQSRVNAARTVQHARYKGSIGSNALLNAASVGKYCQVDAASQTLLMQAIDRLGLSNRAYHRILRVARTIADLASAVDISIEHVAEAVQYRSLDRRYWG